MSQLDDSVSMSGEVLCRPLTGVGIWDLCVGLSEHSELLTVSSSSQFPDAGSGAMAFRAQRLPGSHLEIRAQSF